MNKTIINDEPGRRVIELDARRFWKYRINLLQTQDYNRFGTQFMPIPMFKTNDNPSAPTWIIFSLISGSKELWQVINTKESPFRLTGWEGWVLTAIQYYCFKNNTITIDKNSSFKIQLQ